MNWLFFNSGKGNPAFNMAPDEALLENASSLEAPVLRFYGWTEPAATFGYFQKFSEVERQTHLRPLIRRPTGGGIVPHDADWTYSYTAPPAHEWYELKAEESYRRIHEWICQAFARLKIETELAPDCKKTLPGQCFAGYEKHDLLWRGKKIAGAAQRRNKFGLLIQGSVQPPLVSIVGMNWEGAMRSTAEERFGIHWEDFPPGIKILARADELARQKYSLSTYNQRR
jgi:lipoyl(octanoyl) transferase